MEETEANSEESRENSISLRWADRLCDLTCAAFAGWTLAVHASIGLGGNLYLLLWVATATLLAIGLLIRRLGPRTPFREREAPALELPTVQWMAVLATAVAVNLYLFTGNVIWTWWFCVVVLAVGALHMSASATPSVAIAREPVQAGAGWLWPIAALCCGLTLIAHRPDIDDAFYLNLGVAAADHPGWRLFAQDTMHGVADLPLLLEAYRVHSYELLNGALSFATGIPVAVCFYFISASAASILVPLAYGRLFRNLIPAVWLWGVVCVVAVLIAFGDAHRSHGNFAFVRIWQGKSIFLCVALPLIYAYAIEFVRRPSLRGWLLLAAAQIAGIGLTSSALWGAPFAAGLGLCAGAGLRVRKLPVVVLGVLASSYVIAAGLAVLGSMELAATTAASDPTPVGFHLRQTLQKVLGTGSFHLAAIAAVMATWALWRPGPAQRFAIVVPLGALLLAGPYWENFTRSYATGPSHWRSMWALPLPALFALLLCAPLQWRASTRWRSWAIPTTVAGMAVLLLFLPERMSLGPDSPGTHGARIARPGLKVPPEPYAIALRMREVAPGRNVIVPPKVGAWLPTIHHHAYPLVVRDSYLRRYAKVWGEDESLARALVSRYVAGEEVPPFTPILFEKALDHYAIAAVCVKDSEHSAPIGRLLRDQGFSPIPGEPGYSLWQRAGQDINLSHSNALQNPHP